MLGLIFGKAQIKFQGPVLRVVALIDAETWTFVAYGLLALRSQRSGAVALACRWLGAKTRNT